jgi:hypothetical protein
MTHIATAPTGAAFGEFDEPATWKVADASDWDCTRLRHVENSSIRDALDMFDAALAASSAFRLFASQRRVARTVEVIADRDISLDWLVETDNVGDGTPLITEFELDSAVPLEEQPAVVIVKRLTEVLGMPQRDVLRAAGISKSTFHTWDKPNGARPRVNSQGRLWALAEAVEDLIEHLGTADRVGPWLLADNGRKTLLRAGEFDRLLDLAAPPAVIDSRPYLAGLYAAGLEKLESRTASGARPGVRVVDSDDSFERVPRSGGSR